MAMVVMRCAPACVVLLCCSFCDSQTPVIAETTKIVASDANIGDFFAVSVALDDGVALVGVRNDDDGGTDTGAAHIFRFDGVSWNEEQILLSGSAAPWFGFAVALQGDVALVGSPLQALVPGTVTGAAHVFRYDGSTWQPDQVLFPDDGANGDNFGWSVAISDDVAVIGSLNSNDTGAVYVYRYDGAGWNQEQKLLTSDGEPSDLFGAQVAVHDTVVVGGAPFDDDACPANPMCNSGAAYFFRFTGSEWVEEQKVTLTNGGEGDLFGRVSVNGDVALVGAFATDGACPGVPGCYSGSAYVYRFTGQEWVLEQELTPSDAAQGQRFGASVHIEGGVALVGAVGDGLTGLTGAVYEFRYANGDWEEKAKLESTDGEVGDSFGSSLDMWGSLVIVGAPFDDDACPTDADCNSGSAYVFDIGTDFVRGDCNSDAVLTIIDGIYGLNYLFVVGSPVPSCLDACDADDGGSVSLVDMIFILNYLFVPGMGPPPEPTLVCGEDPTDDGVSCIASTCP